MEGLLFCAASMAVLVGLGALVEAARPRRPGRQADAPLRVDAASAAILTRRR